MKWILGCLLVLLVGCSEDYCLKAQVQEDQRLEKARVACVTQGGMLEFGIDTYGCYVSYHNPRCVAPRPQFKVEQ